MKLLVGRKFDDPDVQRELSKVPFSATKLENGGVGINVTYNDEKTVISAEHFMAMMLVKAKQIAMKANNNVGIGDAVLAVPHWFTDAQRRGILSACEIADLNCLKVVNESTAVAISYGIYKSAKKLFSETDPVHIMFIDLGYTCYSVTIAAFVQERLQVLATVCDRELGGRDFDDVIISYMTEVFQKKTGISLKGNVKANLKMQAAAEKAKKTLSPIGVTDSSISVECLANDTDLNCVITKDEFEARCAPLLQRLIPPLEQCLAEAKLSAANISEIEIVGGSSRVNAVKRTIGQYMGLDPSLLNYGLKTTMNSDEAVARGSALQCAMLSSRVKVKPFNIIDKLPYDIIARYDAPASSSSVEGKEDDDDEDEEGGASTAASSNEALIFQRGESVPRPSKRMTFLNRNSSFNVSLLYGPASYELLPDKGKDPLISTHHIQVPAEFASAPPGNKVRLTFSIDKHSCVVLSSACYMERLPDVVPPESKEGDSKEGKDAELPNPPSKKRYRRVELNVQSSWHGLSKEQIKAAILQESLMQSEVSHPIPK